MSARPSEAPSLGVLATGGVGVLVVLAFVGAVVLGRSSTVGPGDRLAVVKVDGPAGFAVLAGRCEDERVTAVEVRVPGGPPLWRVESARGLINRTFVVGADAPFGAETAVALQPLPAGDLEAVVAVDGVEDGERFDPDHLESADAPEAPCDGADLGVVPLLFVVGAAGVVFAYGTMVRSYLRR